LIFRDNNNEISYQQLLQKEGVKKLVSYKDTDLNRYLYLIKKRRRTANLPKIRARELNRDMKYTNENF
jgi:hypothetical protein